VGIAGVVGASFLAYTDTVKPAVADVGADAAMRAPGELVPSPAENLPPAPEVVTTTEGPPPPPIPATTAPPAAEDPQQTTVEHAPVGTYTPVPEYTPQYTPEPTVEQAPPAPIKHRQPRPKLPDNQAAQSHPDDGDGAELLPARDDFARPRDIAPSNSLTAARDTSTTTGQRDDTPVHTAATDPD
jgi:hypothetical protein